MSKIDHSSDQDLWNKIFEKFNKILKLKISFKKLTSYGILIEGAKSVHVQRLFEVYEKLKEQGMVGNQSDLAILLGTSQQILTNMKQPQTRQDVTMKMLVSLSKAVPNINAYYIMGLSDDMFRQVPISIMHKVIERQEQMEKEIEALRAKAEVR